VTEHRTFGQRVAYGVRIVSVRLRFIGLLVAVMLLAAYWDDVAEHVKRWRRPASPESAAHGATEYFCPMHPQVVRDEPGTCPICGMPLSQRAKTAAQKLPEGVIARVQFSPYRIAQGGIRTTVVDRRPLEREIEAAGTVEFDERRLARIAARFPARIESLAVDFTGTRVEKGAPLATVYSPEILAAEDALLSALRTAAAAESAVPPRAEEAARARSMADAARQRLALWGVAPGQIDAIAARGEARATVELLSPIAGVVTRKAVVPGDYVMEGAALFDVADLSSVWLVARVHEDDAGAVAAGQKVGATARTFPGRTFEGTVAFVAPTIDRTTRTAEVRADVPNESGELRPGMFVTATLRVSATGGAKDAVAVPESAVVDTGRRRIVYVESSPGVFDAHEVVVGPRCGAWYPLISGLDAGAAVATAGSFLIDAETRLDPSAAGAYFGASGTPAKAPK
jgi:Cu(I)/Ag(I) efflux system membrane fusion protein